VRLRKLGPVVVKAYSAAALILIAVPACSASHYQQASCTSHRQSVSVLEAQAIPTAAYIPCILRLPAGWSFGGSEVRSGFARSWLNSDRAGIHAAELTFTRTCDPSRGVVVPLKAGPPGLQRFDEPIAMHRRSSVSYFVFRGGCVTYRLSFSRSTAPTIFEQADRFLGFTPRSLYVRGNLHDVGLTLCGTDAPPCPG
jgi:hypothetical protein